MPRVVHFEIGADDPERVVEFYSNVFNWKIEKWEGSGDYWLTTTGDNTQPGINGGIMRRMDPQMTTVNSIDVQSVDDFAAKITANKGKIVVPKMAIPGVGYIAYCQDTEGNIFGIWQDDTSVR